MKMIIKCSICGKAIDRNQYPSGSEYIGCNAQPVNDGVCCEKCDQEIVSPRRLRDRGFEVDDGFITKLNKEMSTA